MFTFEHSLVSSPSFREEGVLIIPQTVGVFTKYKDLHPLFVPKDRSVPFFTKPDEGFSLNDYFDKDSDELDNIFTKSSNLLSLWKELEEADIVGHEFSTWTVLDTNSNIILEVSQIEGHRDNMLEVCIKNESVLHTVLQTAYEQNFVLSKAMYHKYIEITRVNLAEELKNLGDDGTYAANVNNVLRQYG